MNDTYKIRALGGALVVTLPQKLVRELSLQAGDDVVVQLTGLKRSIVIHPVKLAKNGDKRRSKQ